VDLALRKLEFPKVLERIAHHAMSSPGRDAVARITPFASSAAIRRRLDETTAAKEILVEEHAVPLSSFRDIRPHLRKAAVAHQGLPAVELLDIALVLRTSREMHLFLKRRTERFPALAHVVPTLILDRVVEYNITQAIDEQGMIRDAASHELRRLRNDMASTREGLQRRLASILRRVSEQEFAQDEIITTRDGRLVIPIKSEFKGRVPGFVHSSSASGATVFIEPTETLELNNSLRELQLAEQREILRILAALTAQVAEVGGPLEASYHTLVDLDALFASARYSIEIVGVAPEISDAPIIRIEDGRHPVLLQRHDRSEVVALSVDLGGPETSLVITGPNAGGKTVALKTIGLLCVCAASGLHVPAGSATALFPFERFFVDIGDDQSIEHDLSTFSSHLVLLRTILDGADERSLVLVDEIGSGTDPEEGSALAMAVLEELRIRRALCVATTHQGSLKAFAHSTEGIANGSMEFDPQTLRPTFRFRPGIPGSSYALELAGRIGLSSEILDRARRRLGSDKTRLESLLVELDRRRQEMLEAQESLRQRSEAVDRSTVDLAERLKALREESRAEKARAVREAREIVKNASRTIEQAVRDVRESSGDLTKIKAARGQVESQKTILEAQEREVAPPMPEESVELALGDRVRMRAGSTEGEIVDIEGERATVVVGSMRVRMELRDLVRMSGSRAATTGSPSTGGLELPTASPEVDVRGLTGDEAIVQVEMALERAVVAGLHRVDIIHGKGTGALRKRVTEYLKNAPHVRAHRLADWNEGGAGVTVVELD
jgi:DNA mismatch repair protein MutS2